MENVKGYVKFDKLIKPQITPGGLVIASEVSYSMAGYAKGMVLILANLADGHTISAQLRCYLDAALGTGADVTSFTKVLTGTAGVSSFVGCIDFDAMDLTKISALKYFVGVTLTASHAGDWASACLLRVDARDYSPGTSGELS
jgi:hypothetical protein